jgi:hypothetical protein
MFVQLLRVLNEQLEELVVKKRTATKKLEYVPMDLALTEEEATKVVNSDVWPLINQGIRTYAAYEQRGATKQCGSCKSITLKELANV